MLDGKKHDKAIESYIRDVYNVEIINIPVNSIFLLDGINEAPYAIRKEHENGSYLFQEIKRLLKKFEAGFI